MRERGVGEDNRADLMNTVMTRHHQDGELLSGNGLRSSMKPVLTETSNDQEKTQQLNDK